MLRTFVEPKPVRWVIALTGPLVRIFMLQGVPFLRAVPVLNRFALIAGVAKVREIDMSQADIDKLKAVHGRGKAVVYAPNHPEFFTDWMIDRYLTARFSYKVASLASYMGVNGMGWLMQKFWLANNLIAQIPGNSKAAIDFSVKTVLAGNGIVFHPEGGVGWHANHIGPIYPGVFFVASRALQRARSQGLDIKVYVQPIVWKMVFIEDVTVGLNSECAYVERKLDISRPVEKVNPAARVFHVFDTLLRRDERRWGLNSASSGYQARRSALIGLLENRLGELMDEVSRTGEFGGVLRNARRWLRLNRTVEHSNEVKEIVQCLARHQALGDFVFENRMTTQEEVAEHIKRLRRDYCTGSWRDTLNNHVAPVPVGLRRVYIRVPEPLCLNLMTKRQRADGSEILRKCLQAELDDLIAEISRTHRFVRYRNPFVL